MDDTEFEFAFRLGLQIQKLENKKQTQQGNPEFRNLEAQNSRLHGLGFNLIESHHKNITGRKVLQIGICQIYLIRGKI
jgi:hypothetical protein